MRNRGLTNMLVKPRLAKIPATSAAMRDTVHLTGMGGAAEPNVVPSEVWAQYDCRLLPGTSPAEMLDRLKRATRGMEGVRWEVIAEATANRSPVDDPLYEAIASYAVEGDPDAAAGPILSVGFTDSLHVRPLGVHAYGYVPVAVLPEDVERMHGHDERVPTEQLTEGLRRLFSIVVAFAGER